MRALRRREADAGRAPRGGGLNPTIAHRLGISFDLGQRLSGWSRSYAVLARRSTLLAGAGRRSKSARWRRHHPARGVAIVGRPVGPTCSAFVRESAAPEGRSARHHPARPRPCRDRRCLLRSFQRFRDLGVLPLSRQMRVAWRSDVRAGREQSAQQAIRAARSSIGDRRPPTLSTARAAFITRSGAPSSRGGRHHSAECLCGSGPAVARRGC